MQRDLPGNVQRMKANGEFLPLRPGRMRHRFALELFAGCARLTGALLEAGLRCTAPPGAGGQSLA